MSKLRELSRELGAEIIYFIPSENDIVLINGTLKIFIVIIFQYKKIFFLKKLFKIF